MSPCTCPTVSADERDRLRRVADTCPVRRALEAGFEFCERIEPGSVSASTEL
jgi:hypothetical protein